MVNMAILARVVAPSQHFIHLPCASPKRIIHHYEDMDRVFLFPHPAHTTNFPKKLTSPSLAVKTLFIPHAHINVSSFKIAFLVFLLK